MKQYKQTIAILCTLGIFFGGCSNSRNLPEESSLVGNKEEESTTKVDEICEDQLNLYCMSNDVNVDQYITAFRVHYGNITVNKTTFEDSTQMDEKLKSELNAGKGPDIIIFDEQTGLDVLGMAKNGAFQALDDKMIEDDSLNTETYLPGTFEAGKVDGKQYVLPLTFSVPYLTYDKTADLGFDSETVIPFEKYCEVIEANVEALKDNDYYGTLYCQHGYFDVVMGAAQAFDIELEEQNIMIDSQRLKMAVNGFATYVSQLEKMAKVFTLYVKEDSDIAERSSFICHTNPDVTHYAWFWENLYREAGKDKMGISIIGDADGNGVTATVNRYGVLTKDAESYAYEFLRVAMDAKLYSNKLAEYGMSLNKENIAWQIKRHRQTTSVYQSIAMRGLTEEIEEQLVELYDSITDVRIPNPVVRKLCYESFFAYMFENSKTYEECYKEFEQKFNLYVGE
ncbi:MAG: extracellular solute-binding protein [Lachnospiraceae bacterium]|nr:extracellular solute-binding protein [Lachnospiraceae bacterium]